MKVQAMTLLYYFVVCWMGLIEIGAPIYTDHSPLLRPSKIKVTCDVFVFTMFYMYLNFSPWDVKGPSWPRYNKYALQTFYELGFSKTW